MNDSLDVLTKEIVEFVKERGWDQFHHPANLAKSISIEAGELLECFQWDENHFDTEHVKEELADVFTYAIQMAYALDFDIKDIIERKMVKNRNKYPVNLNKKKMDSHDKLK